MEEDLGWIKLHRKVMQSETWANAELYKLFSLCLMHANHEGGWVAVDRVAEPVRVEAGQFITGRFALHEAYYPKKRKANKSPRTLWRWLRILENMQNVVLNVSKRYTVVTVCNWARYQGRLSVCPSKCPTGVQQVSTNKNDKNDKKREDRAGVAFSNIETETELPAAVRDECDQLAFRIWGTRAYPLAEWAGFYPVQWIPLALRATLEAGGNRPTYTKAVLESWRKGGGPPAGKGKEEPDYGFIA